MEQTTQDNQDKKTVSLLDPISQQYVDVPEGLQEFIGHIVSFNRRTGREPAENENKELKAQLDKLQSELNEVRESSKSKPQKNAEIETIKTEMQNVIAELNKVNEAKEKELKEWQNKFSNQKLYTDIQDALGKFDLHNRQQVVNILSSNAKLKEEFDITTGEKKGTFQTVIALNLPDDNGQVRPVELPALQAAEKFFSVPENQYHLKNKLQPGGGSTGSNTQGVTSTMKRAQFDQLSPVQKIETVKTGVKIID